MAHTNSSGDWTADLPRALEDLGSCSNAYAGSTSFCHLSKTHLDRIGARKNHQFGTPSAHRLFNIMSARFVVRFTSLLAVASAFRLSSRPAVRTPSPQPLALHVCSAFRLLLATNTLQLKTSCSAGQGHGVWNVSLPRGCSCSCTSTGSCTSSATQRRARGGGSTPVEPSLG